MDGRDETKMLKCQRFLWATWDIKLCKFIMSYSIKKKNGNNAREKQKNKAKLAQMYVCELFFTRDEQGFPPKKEQNKEKSDKCDLQVKEIQQKTGCVKKR